MIATVREHLPWHVIEQEMRAEQARRAEAPQFLEDAEPTSGVRASSTHTPAVGAAPTSEPDASALAIGDGLSFKVYTVAELEARGIHADLSMRATRATRASIALTSTKPTPWKDVADAALFIVHTAKAWLAAPKPRASARDTFAAPLLALVMELKAAIRQIDVKKNTVLLVGAGGAVLFLLFAVITAAELTDDLKPSRTVRTDTADAYTTAIIAAQHAPAGATTVTAATTNVKAAPVTKVVDADAVRSAEATPKAATSAVKKRGGKPDPVEVFIP